MLIYLDLHATDERHGSLFSIDVKTPKLDVSDADPMFPDWWSAWRADFKAQ